MCVSVILSSTDWQVPSNHLLNAGHKLTGVTSQVFHTVQLWTALSYIFNSRIQTNKHHSPIRPWVITTSLLPRRRWRIV